MLKLSKNLPNSIGNFGVRRKNFTHGDFLFAKDAHRLVYKNVIEILRKAETEDKKENVAISIRI